jgi:hypothetical protein
MSERREPGIPASRSERPRAGYPGEQRATHVQERGLSGPARSAESGQA